eukprot:gene8200-376_t
MLNGGNLHSLLAAAARSESPEARSAGLGGPAPAHDRRPLLRNALRTIKRRRLAGSHGSPGPPPAVAALGPPQCSECGGRGFLPDPDVPAMFSVPCSCNPEDEDAAMHLGLALSASEMGAADAAAAALLQRPETPPTSKQPPPDPKCKRC